jgi:hypothetical protein
MCASSVSSAPAWMAKPLTPLRSFNSSAPDFWDMVR